jgi:hypothetical protein
MPAERQILSIQSRRTTVAEPVGARGIRRAALLEKE